MQFFKNFGIKSVGMALCISIFISTPWITISGQEDVQQNQLKFGRLLRLIDGYYVDSVNLDDLTEKAIVGILSELDPHSVYISKDEVEEMNMELKGNFEGVGISFNIFKDTLLVLSTVSGGPSEKVGVRAGDRIVEVDNKNIAGIGLKNSDVFGMLRGDKGTKVDIKVLRKNNKEPLDFTITRDKIPLNSLDASYMLDESTGYIKLNKFSATTNDEFAEAIMELKKENLKNLILDLRGNGGGYLKTSIEIADQFLNNNQLIVYTSGLNQPKRDYSASFKGEFEDGNLVVLVDEHSASASEIVSGAVQDWDRGLVVGRRSFGKGLVQNQYFLTDGSMVRLTIAHYYTPSGRCIQKPYEDGVTDYRMEVMKRWQNGELLNEDSIHFADSLKYKTLVNERVVFGGGGITPDIFIPRDTSSHYGYLNKLVSRNNIIYNYALDYIDKNRKEIKKKYPDFEKFEKEFEVTEDMIAEVIKNGEKEGIEKNEESLEYIKDVIKKQIKAYTARDIYSRNDFYKVINKDDEAVNAAIKVIENQKEYNNLLVSTDE